jgi:hypothetical protein
MQHKDTQKDYISTRIITPALPPPGNIPHYMSRLIGALKYINGPPFLICCIPSETTSRYTAGGYQLLRMTDSHGCGGGSHTCYTSLVKSSILGSHVPIQSSSCSRLPRAQNTARAPTMPVNQRSAIALIQRETPVAV